MSRVGIIGDTHLPFEHEGYLDFCKKMFKQWQCDTIIHIGDLIDHHALSFHDSEPELKGANGERIDAIEHLQPWYKAFPELTLIYGNHDKIPKRQLNKLGMDAEVWMRPLEEVYDMPEGWKLTDTVWLDMVCYHHGETALGANGFRNDAMSRMCNTVSGHAHGNAGISAFACEHRLVWGMAVGCGIDAKKMAFAYGKNFKQKPILACGIVIDGEPFVEFMNLGEKSG